jgi:hypothetical protein
MYTAPSDDVNELAIPPKAVLTVLEAAVSKENIESDLHRCVEYRGPSPGSMAMDWERTGVMVVALASFHTAPLPLWCFLRIPI